MEKTETTLRHPYEFLNISKKSNKLTRISGVVNAQKISTIFSCCILSERKKLKKKKEKRCLNTRVNKWHKGEIMAGQRNKRTRYQNSTTNNHLPLNIRNSQETQLRNMQVDKNFTAKDLLNVLNYSKNNVYSKLWII